MATVAAVASTLVAAAAALLVDGGQPARSTPGAAPEAQPAVLHVDPNIGSAVNDGSEARPLGTINAAMEKATPGSVIHLKPGVYREHVRTVRAGEPGAPITVRGPGSADRARRSQAVLYGSDRVFNVNHSHYVIEGFTIDGQERLARTPFPADIRTINAFKDSIQPKVDLSRLIYIGSDDGSRDITGVRVTNMHLRRAGGECVRLRNNARSNEISGSLIEYCGVRAQERGEDHDRYHNGEGVYIGTSPKSDDQPMKDNDQSSRNVVRNNVIRPFGSECFNVKENAHDNVMEHNVCAGNVEGLEHNGSNVEIRGHGNVVRFNRIATSAGAAVKIRSDDARFDKGGNVVAHNTITATAVGLHLVSTAEQGPICGNRVQAERLFDDEGRGPRVDLTSAC